MDLSTLSLVELRALPGEVAVEIAKRESVEKAMLMSDLEKIAKERGFDLKTLVGGSKAPAARRQRANVAPKYANPSNPEQTWTGRGRKPVWVVDCLAAGQTMEDLAIS